MADTSMILIGNDHGHAHDRVMRTFYPHGATAALDRYLQDWLSDAESAMSWRLRKESAGSGALGDIASHAIDQIQFLLDDTVTEVTGQLRTLVTERRGPRGPEAVTVDDTAWITLGLSNGAGGTVEASRLATGRKNSLQIDIYGSKGSVTFDLETLNELQFFDATLPIREQGFRRILVTEPEHPYAAAWWPQGHIIGWEHTFTHQMRDFLSAIASDAPPAPSFEDGLHVQRILAAVEESAQANGTMVHLAAQSITPKERSLGAPEWVE